MNIFSPHISFTELADLADEHSTASAEALKHLSACSSCSRQLQTMQQTIGLMKSDSAENAPAELVEYAKNIFSGPAVNRKASRLERLVAAVTFDSLTAAPAFGLRSATNAGRQLVYSTDTADIEVRVVPENEDWTVAGQILGSNCESGDVKLEGDDFSVAAELNELCEFSFRSVPGGAYKIVVRLADSIIETPQLELRL